MIGGLFKGATAVAAPWLAAIKPFWPLLWRAAVLFVVWFVGWRCGHDSANEEAQARELAAAEAMVAGMEQVRREQADMEARSRAVETDYEAAKTELEQVRRDIPARVVRLCQSAAYRGAVSGVSRPAGQPVGPADGDADLSGTAGPDIGPALYALADECDDNARRLDALQRWTRDVPAAEVRPK